MEDVHREQCCSLWELMLSKENLLVALNRVEVNRGAPGVDGMTTAELRPWVAVRWPEVRAELDAGIYRPAPVRQVIIPKPGGGERMLGVPRVLDRLIQQAIAQVLVPRSGAVSALLGNGRPVARATGGSRDRSSSIGHCPTLTGKTLACACSSRPGNG
ncbi:MULTISPECIES: hypothetical protein [unclassified Streptomyces]|uniref:hypothetical protein n=1 Tax=unclassified Streptomyces TaxID=2593676 RepID=UPI001904D036|nr:hypothetical protein [Streptomyces sp. HSG2]